MSHSVNKIGAERAQRTLLELANQPGNDVCADCKARAPRWASVNLGIFICVNCASVHRKMGTHISKVKSLTLDTWTKDQVEFMRQNGNIKSNSVYSPDELRHPPPTNMADSERDSELEKYIRSKYEFKSFLSKHNQVAALLGPSRSLASVKQAQPTLSATMPAPAHKPASPPPPALPPKNAAPPLTTQTTPSASAAAQSVSQPAVMSTYLQQAQPQQPQLAAQVSAQPHFTGASTNMQWSTAGAQSTTTSPFPATSASQPIPGSQSFLSPSAPNAYSTLSASPGNPFPTMSQPTGILPGGIPRSMSMSTGLSTPGTGMNFGTSPSQGTIAGAGFNPNPGSSFNPSQGMSSTMTGASQFQMQPQPTGFAPNPFAAQSLNTGSSMSSMGGYGVNGMNGMNGMFSPQPQQQAQSTLSPFGTSPSPYRPSSSPSFTAPFQPSPSPSFVGNAPSQPSSSPNFATVPFQQQQQPNAGLYGQPTGNPFMQQQQQQGQFGGMSMNGGGTYGAQAPPSAPNPFTAWTQGVQPSPQPQPQMQGWPGQWGAQ